jgi:small multidrug resistance pump
MSWFYLAIAIAAEIVATTALKASEGFSRLYPSIFTCIGYGIAFYCLALALRTIPVGVAYAIWSGAGIVAISIIGYVLFRQSLDFAAVTGIGLIVAGVIVLNVFSRSTGL